MSPNDDDLYAGLRTEAAPPAQLESRVIGALRQRGLLRPRMSNAMRFAYAAAAVLLFFAGFGFHVLQAREAAPKFTHVLFLHNGEAVTAEGSRARIAEYGAWARQLRADGVTISGTKLKGGGAPNGYFLIRASSSADAQRVAASCPHVRHGGSIVIREIDDV